MRWHCFQRQISSEGLCRALGLSEGGVVTDMVGWNSKVYYFRRYVKSIPSEFYYKMSDVLGISLVYLIKNVIFVVCAHKFC